MAETTDRPIAQEMSREHMRKLKIAAAHLDLSQRAAVEKAVDELYAKLEQK